MTLCLLSGGALLGQTFTNGDFENGDLSGCYTTGSLGQVEVLRSTNFSPNIAAAGGTYMVLIASGPNDPNMNYGDIDGSGTNEYDVSTLTVGFLDSNAPTRLCLDWAFLTSEQFENAPFDDIFRVQLDGVNVLTRSVRKPGGVSPYPDTGAYNGTNYTVNSPGLLNGANFSNGVTSFTNFCTTVTTNGVHTLEFLVADQGDTQLDSGLLIDNITVDSICVDLSLVQLTNSNGSIVEVKNGGFVFSAQSNSQVAASDDGQVVAFTSSADYTGGNPNVRKQIFVLENGSFERLTSATGEHVGSPSLTSNGRFVAFEYAGDPLGTNPDGNIEIFRFDRSIDTLVQITDTSGCSNTRPAISHTTQGRRIAFLSDCHELEPGDGFNPDGNREVVLYDANSGNFQYNGTSGCDNNSVVISTHTAGRYVTFVSSCNYTGGNNDLNSEIFQWDRQNDSYRQITSSTLASGAINDVPSSTDSGNFVAFISNANYGNQNAAGNMVVYRWARTGNSITRITTSSASFIYSYVSIDDSGDQLAYERFNLNTFELEVLHRTISSGVETMIADANAQLPVVGVNGTPNVTFLSNANYSGTNGDLNQEIWRGEP